MDELDLSTYNMHKEQIINRRSSNNNYVSDLMEDNVSIIALQVGNSEGLCLLYMVNCIVCVLFIVQAILLIVSSSPLVRYIKL